MTVAGWRLEIHESLPSTSDLCIARAEAGEAAGLAILARRQTQGRGSRGRSWSDPPSGNLAVSILLRPDFAAEPPGLWPFLAGLALRQALGPERLVLKWPNDVLFDDRKLAGILIERGGDWMVIGFGANLAHRPDLPDRKIACLAERGPPPLPETVAWALVAECDRRIAQFRRAGFEPVRADWLAGAHPVGTRLAVRPREILAGAGLVGRFAGISSDGALLLDVDGAVHRIDTGDILLLDGS